MDVIWAEAMRAVEGYTVSASGAVLGRFRDVYLMRSGSRRLDLNVEDTTPEALYRQWQQFRAEYGQKVPT